MHLKSALVAGTLALQASAFLVPLEISKAAGEAKAQLESIWSQSTQTVELDCPNCPFFGPGDTLTTWDEDDENKLVSRTARQRSTRAITNVISIDH